MKKVTLKLHPAHIGGMRNIQYRSVPINMSNQRVHWSVKYKWNKAWLEQVGWAVLEHNCYIKPKPVKNPRIEITLFTTRPMDRDNAYHSVKPIIDALTVKNGIGVIEDDSETELKDLKVKSKKVHHKVEEHVEITIKFD